MQASETSQDSVGVIERPSLRAAAALNPIRQGSTPATAENTEAPAQPQQPQQDVSDSDSEVGIPTSCGFAVQGGVGSSGVGGARLLSASLPPMAPPTLSSLPRHPTESSQSHSHDDPLLAGGNANAMSHSSQFYNSQSQSHTVGQLPGIISNSGSFRNMAPAGTNNNNNQGMATPSSQGLIGVVGSENGGSGVYSQTPSMTRFRADPALHHQHQQQPTFSNTNHVLSPSPPSSKGGAAGNNNSTYTTVMIGSGGTAGGSGTFSGRGVGARTVGGSDNLSHSNGSGFQAALQGEHFHPLQVSPFPGNIGTTNGHGSPANYVHIQGSNVPMHPVPNQSASVASHASDNVGSQSFTGSVDAAAGSHGHGALSRFSYQQQPLSSIPSTTTAIGNSNNTAYKNHQQFHSPLVPVGPPTASAAADCSGGSFVVSSNNNNNNRSGSFDGVRVGVTPMMSSYQVHNHHHNIAFNQSSSTSNRYNTTRNTSSSPNPPTTVNNHTTTTTSGFMTTTPSDLLMTSNHNNFMNSSSPLMAMFNNNTANSTPHQQYHHHHHKQHQQAFHMSSSLPLSEGPLTLVSPANAVTNSSCLSGDVPMSGGAIPTYETTGRPMDAFEMAMLREQYLHGAFHVAVDPSDMAGKKKRRRRKRKKNASGADMSGSDEDNDDAANNGAGTGVEGSLKNAPKPDIKSKSRVLIVPGVPVHLPLVGKVGFISYATILKQYASLQAKKTQSAAPAATTTNATTTAKPDFANDTANAVDAAIKSADAADKVDDDDDDAAAPPSYTDVLIDDDDDDKTTAAATTSTAQARLFVGQVPYSIELDLMKAIFFVIGGGCDVDHVERIVKWKNRELPSGCLHVHINVEYKLSDHPEGSNTDPTETSSVVHHALKLDQVALLDDEGIWVPTSNRRAFSIVDTHVEAFEAFLSRQNEHEASAAAATSATATTTRSQCGDSTNPSPAASQDLSQYGPPMPRTMGTFGLTFDEFKGFLKGCAKEVRNTMPDYAVTWSEEDERLGHVDTNTTSHLPPVPVIHPDIAAIAIHGRNGGAHATKPPTSAATQDTQHQNEGAHQVDSAAATVVVSGAVANPCEAVAKGLLCLPVPGFGGTLPHTRPLTFTHNNTANANTKDVNGSSQSTTTSNCEGEKPSTQQEQPHHVTSTLIVRPPKGPEDPEFVVPSLSDQRDALVAYVAYLKDMTSMVCRPIDRPYQLMSVQRARSTFLPQKSASSKNNSSNQASSTKNQSANNNINNSNNIAAAQQRVQSHNGGSGFSTSTTPFQPTHHHHHQQQPMFPNQQHYDPTFLMQQQQHQAMLYQQQQQQQFHHYQQQNQQHQQFGFTNHQQQNQNNFTPHMQPHQHQHVQQTTNMYGGYQQIGGTQQQAAFQNNNTNNNKKNNNASLMYQQQQPTQNHFNNSNNTNNPPIYHQQQQQQHPIYWKQ